jgi:hypothetical protein
MAFMTLGEFSNRLNEMLAHAPRDLPLRINGEYLESLSISVQNPIVSEAAKSGMVERKYDESRSSVIDIDANGRESVRLPEMHRDLRAW